MNRDNVPRMTNVARSGESCVLEKPDPADATEETKTKPPKKALKQEESSDVEQA